MSDWGVAVASELLYREAELLDGKQWDQWLALYQEKAVYWVPAWLDEYDVVTDPTSQVSLIYHDNRSQLEERVARIESRKSITALPLPRTVHLISNVRIVSADDQGLAVAASFMVCVYDPRTAREHSHFGRYAYRLVKTGGELRIAVKKIILSNDRVPTVVDFYCL
jgi:3-phenylpropionate/cinnamic acid dioxygenase small subunit